MWQYPGLLDDGGMPEEREFNDVLFDAECSSGESCKAADTHSETLMYRNTCEPEQSMAKTYS